MRQHNQNGNGDFGTWPGDVPRRFDVGRLLHGLMSRQTVVERAKVLLLAAGIAPEEQMRADNIQPVMPAAARFGSQVRTPASPEVRAYAASLGQPAVTGSDPASRIPSEMVAQPQVEASTAQYGAVNATAGTEAESPTDDTLDVNKLSALAAQLAQPSGPRM